MTDKQAAEWSCWLASRCWRLYVPLRGRAFLYRPETGERRWL